MTDDDRDEPLGPATPDEQTDLGDTAEAHDEISPHDVPAGSPEREATEAAAGGRDGVTKGPIKPGEEHGARTGD